MSKSVLGASKYIRTALQAKADVSAKVGNNIFPLVAPSGTKGDYILYAREDYEEKAGQTGTYEEKAAVTLNINSVDYDRGLDIAESVRNVIRELRSLRQYGIKITHSREDVAGLTDKGQTVFTQIIEIEISDL